MSGFSHCGQRFEPLGESGRYYAVTTRLDDRGRTWAVDPRDCPQFDSEVVARRWAEEIDALQSK